MSLRSVFVNFLLHMRRPAGAVIAAGAPDPEASFGGAKSEVDGEGDDHLRGELRPFLGMLERRGYEELRAVMTHATQITRCAFKTRNPL